MSFEIKTIGEIFGDVKIGGTPPREKAEYFGGGIPWVSIKDMGKGKYVSETNETLSESGVQNSNVKLIKKGSLLFSFKLTVGRMCFAGTDLYTNEAIAAFEPNSEIMLEYLYYVLPVATKQVKRTNNFGAPLLNKDQIKKLQIPLPPLETQKAIVAKLDQIFAELDQTKSEIQKNLDNTDELWKSAYDLKIEELKEKYGLKKLEEICSLITDGSHFSPKTTTEGLPYITVKDIDDEGNIDTENSKKISEEDFAVLVQNGCQPKKGDVLYSKDGTIGKIHLVNDENFVVLSSLAIIRPGKDVKSEYLYQIFHSNFFEKQAVGNKTGAAIKRIVLKTIKSLQIPVPPLSEQEKIVEHLDQVSKEVKALKSQYQSQLDNLEELKKSVLDKAFRGEMG